MKLSQQLIQEMQRKGLIKTSATAPSAADPAGTPVAPPAPVPQGVDPTAMAPAPMPAMPTPGMDPSMAGAMPVDPNAMAGAMPPIDPAMLASLMPGAAPAAAPGAMPAAPMPPMDPSMMAPPATPPIERESTDNSEKLQKALDDVMDKLDQIAERLKALESDRDEKQTYSGMDDFFKESGEEGTEKEASTEDPNVFQRLLHKVFPAK